MLLYGMNQTEIESLHAEIEYMREIGCDKLANVLIEDLRKEYMIQIDEAEKNGTIRELFERELL